MVRTTTRLHMFRMMRVHGAVQVCMQQRNGSAKAPLGGSELASHTHASQPFATGGERDRTGTCQKPFLDLHLPTWAQIQRPGPLCGPSYACSADAHADSDSVQ